MKRSTIIKATAWIHFGIVMLSMYTIARIPEHIGFASVAFIFSMIWLTAYVWTNCGKEEFYKTEISFGKIGEKLQGMAAKGKKN